MVLMRMAFQASALEAARPDKIVQRRLEIAAIDGKDGVSAVLSRHVNRVDLNLTANHANAQHDPGRYAFNAANLYTEFLNS